MAIVKYEQALMPRITTRISAIWGRHLLIFLGIYEFLAFLTALEIFLLNEKYFSTDSKKTYFYKKKIFGSDTARPKWLPVGQPNLTLSCLDFTIVDENTLLDNFSQFYCIFM